MIKHIVMWKLKDLAEGASKADNARKMKEMLEALEGTVPGMKKLEVGISECDSPDSFDVVLYTEFADRAALQAYQDHPDHLAVKPFIGKVRFSRCVVDYDTKAPRRKHESRKAA